MGVLFCYGTTVHKNIMIIAELIKELEQYPQDTRVVIRGYEGGMDDVDEVELTEIYLNYNAGTWYYGNHEEVSSISSHSEGKYEKVSAVHLI